MTIRRRSVVLTGMAALVPALAGLALTSTPAAAAHPLSTSPSGQRVRAYTAASRSAAGPSEAVGAEAVSRPPGHGVTLDAAEEPAAVQHARHDAAGERRVRCWFTMSRTTTRLPPRARGTSSRRIRRAATSTGRGARSRRCRPDYAPLYFASAILPDGRMIVEGGEYNRVTSGVDEQGRDLQPADQHLGFRRTATGLGEHRGRRERGPAQRHLHARAGLPELPDGSRSVHR